MSKTRALLVLFLATATIVFAQTAKTQRKPPAQSAPPPAAAAQPAPAAAAPSSGPVVGAVMLKTLKARSIGPAVMGGRISDIAFDPKDAFTYYVGFSTGGLVKTSDGGTTFDAVTEKLAVASIGAVAVAPSDSKIVWLGTGEASDRNSAGWGDGVYRSTDSGENWTNVGLKTSRVIGRIVVHPTDANTAWVAAGGDVWNPGGERGLYKTTDGGVSWKAALTAPAPYNDRVGCVDVVLDPADPNTLYAALYARRRTPWSFVSGPALTDGQDLGGIFKSADGGATWKKLEKGLPGQLQRIGLAISARNPKVVYAVVQSAEGGTSNIEDVRSKMGGVFRSEDGGDTWTRMSPLDPRPFYFSQIRVDPENEQRVYVLGFALHVSEDGGKTYREDLGEKVHPDLHALAIEARHPQHLLLGTDGGLYESFNGGKAWAHANRVAAGEYYRINYDMSTPYRICGGLQDNLNWVGPSQTRTKDGILNADWINIGGGDGFYCVFDPSDRNLVYTESQQGTLHTMDLANGQIKELRPEPGEGQPAFRFNWNSPLIGSRHVPGTLYLAGNHVFRLSDKAKHWQMISPDLTAQIPSKMITTGSGAETYDTVFTLAESPVQAGLLWAGTDDGKVWVTENDGGSWTDLTGNLPSEVKGQWISRIEASWADPKVAYMAVDEHRSGNFAPFVYRTADLGKTWQSIAGGLPREGPVKVVREDPESPNLLYAGSEYGLFASFDRGGHWARFGDVPTVAVDDIAVHTRDNDLIVATHGRSLYILDNVTPLQQLTAEVLGKDAWLFPPRPAFGANLLPGFIDWDGKAIFRGLNPSPGASLSFYVKAYTGDEVKITIKNAEGQPVAKLTAPGTPGIGRVSWDLKPTKDLLNEYGGEGQKFVRSGEYTVELTHGEAKSIQKLKVEIAPGIETR